MNVPCMHLSRWGSFLVFRSIRIADNHFCRLFWAVLEIRQDRDITDIAVDPPHTDTSDIRHHRRRKNVDTEQHNVLRDMGRLKDKRINLTLPPWIMRNKMVSLFLYSGKTRSFGKRNYRLPLVIHSVEQAPTEQQTEFPAQSVWRSQSFTHSGGLCSKTVNFGQLRSVKIFIYVRFKPKRIILSSKLAPYFENVRSLSQIWEKNKKGLPLWVNFLVR